MVNATGRGIGTLAYAFDVTLSAVECINTDGMTVWLADSFAEAYESVGKRNVEAQATRRDRANKP